MITIVEPKEHIDRLWGKQQVKDQAVYRMMRYVLRVDHDSKVLLHNVVTGRLVALEQVEAEAVEKLPMAYDSVLESLVTEHYLVPEDYDENRQAINLRKILRTLNPPGHTAGITNYVILTTTACNARCYYCYQKGIPTATMSEKTANQVAEFICSHCGDKKQVTITWFGGEPTLASDRIDQICKCLREKDVDYQSLMITNGYLLDNDTIKRAKKIWNLRQATVTIDGTEETYNRTKAYVNPSGSPYQRIMQNIGRLLEEGIEVKIRMNYDVGNWHEYVDLVKEVKDRFPNKKRLVMSAHRILGEYPDPDGILQHEDLAWFEQKKVELDSITQSAGLQKQRNELPSLRYEACGAANDTMAVITPEGNLVSCPDQLGVDQIKGNVFDGVTDFDLVSKWRQFTEYPRCTGCSFMPFCVHMLCCNAKDNCASGKSFFTVSERRMRQAYDDWSERMKGVEV